MFNRDKSEYNEIKEPLRRGRFPPAVQRLFCEICLLNQREKRFPFLFGQLHAQAHALNGFCVRNEVRLHTELRKVVLAHAHPRKSYRAVRNFSVVISEKQCFKSQLLHMFPSFRVLSPLPQRSKSPLSGEG